ncbi:MAG: DUF1501 domain-containing protein [Betaproteobacteria bacterium]|nr:DUF1501 domain-containing protein [Betaproteobacteria bacterium]
MSEAAAQSTSVTDYKALVCVFLYGGNDHYNTLVPYDDTSHANYQRIRTGIALQRSAVAANALPIGNGEGTAAHVNGLAPGRQLALAPELSGLLPLFNKGELGLILNIGTLIQPTTKAQYTAANVPLPPKLFSHNDQQSVWQSSNPEGAISGWGGRMGDLFLSGNGKTTFTCVNASGNAVYMSGREAVQYQVSTSGAVAMRGLAAPLFGSQACSNALRQLVTAPQTHLMRAEYARVTGRSIDAQATLSAALAATRPLQTLFPAGTLSQQLQMVARMIAARDQLSVKRQVFFVSLGGFDLHDFLLLQHPGLMSQLGESLKSFHAAMGELGVADRVTTFTASDFGRTLTSNGDGSDHGWGSHHFVLGGAVQGGRFYGQLPQVAVNGPDDVGQGRLLPTTAVDQLAATLASWMGVNTSDLPLVVPNIGNYSVRDLGLMRRT